MTNGMMRINLHPHLRQILRKCKYRERQKENRAYKMAHDHEYRERVYAKNRSDVPYVRHGDVQIPPEWFDGSQHVAHVSPSVDRWITGVAGLLPTENANDIFSDFTYYTKYVLHHHTIMRYLRLRQIKQSHLRLALSAYLRINNAH